MIGLGLSTLAIAQALATAQLFAGILEGETFIALTVPFVVLAAALILRPAVSALRELVAHAVASRMKRDIRERILRHDAARGPFAVQPDRLGARHALVVDGVENLEPYVTRYIPQVVVTGITAVVAIILLAAIDPVVGASAAVIAAVVPFVPRLWDCVMRRRGDDHWSAYSSMHADVVDSMRGMETLKLLSATEGRRAELARSSATLLATTLRQLRLSLVESGLTGFLLVAGPALALTVGVARVTSGELAAPLLFAIALLSFEAFRPFRDLANHWHAGYLGATAGTRLSQLLESDPTDNAANATISTAVSTTVPDGVAITIEKARVRYPGSVREAITDVSLTIPRGTVTAIVGPSGSGKSTVANLMLGLLTPDSGRVSIAVSSERPPLSLVSQDPVLFSGSLRDNFSMVAPDADDAEMLAALDRAEASELASADRGGLDAPVGDAGALLSGGQRQRVAIARALLRRSPVLVLDEATSALDAHRERTLLASLRNATRQDGSLTVVLIAHRLAAIHDVDQIIVMADGQVVETGRYDDLVAAGGLFANLHAAQSEQVDA